MIADLSRSPRRIYRLDQRRGIGDQGTRSGGAAEFPQLRYTEVRVRGKDVDAGRGEVHGRQAIVREPRSVVVPVGRHDRDQVRAPWIAGWKGREEVIVEAVVAGGGDDEDTRRAPAIGQEDCQLEHSERDTDPPQAQQMMSAPPRRASTIAAAPDQAVGGFRMSMNFTAINRSGHSAAAM